MPLDSLCIACLLCAFLDYHFDFRNCSLSLRTAHCALLSLALSTTALALACSLSLSLVSRSLSRSRCRPCLGFHGASVDSIIRDLVDMAIIQTKNRLRKRFRAKINRAVEERLLDILTGESAPSKTKDSFRELLRDGSLDGREVEFDAPDQMPGRLGAGGPGGFEGAGVATISLENFLGRVIPTAKKRKMSVAECRPFIEEQETEKILNQDVITKQALEAVEVHGIVFIDEIDKICVDHSTYHGTDASSEGVQRDLLPLIEGCIIQTKYGNVDTSKILFMASGAFHSCKPSDLLAELQGRLPIRVELTGLTEDDLYKILTEPENNLICQQVELLKTEGIDVHFTQGAMREIAVMAANVNTTVENIGAR
jgi:ATP-dependent HslUV protease ATP-binding subunit HslU